MDIVHDVLPWVTVAGVATGIVAGIVSVLIGFRRRKYAEIAQALIFLEEARAKFDELERNFEQITNEETINAILEEAVSRQVPTTKAEKVKNAIDAAVRLLIDLKPNLVALKESAEPENASPREYEFRRQALELANAQLQKLDKDVSRLGELSARLARTLTNAHSQERPPAS